MILQGYSHDYERFNPQNSSGTADSTGPISFVVGRPREAAGEIEGLRKAVTEVRG